MEDGKDFRALDTGRPKRAAHFASAVEPQVEGAYTGSDEVLAAIPDGPSSWEDDGGRDGSGSTGTIVIAVLCVALLVAVLAPLLLISPYNHSYADDWHYGVDAHLAIQAGGGFFEVMGASFAEVADTWFSWQGTYSAIWLMALQPGIFSEDAYAIAAPIIIIALLVATFDFFHELFRGWLRSNRATWIAVSSIVVAITLLLQPSAVEGIFWYNSAVYYTFYHSLLLGLAARILAIARLSRQGEGNAPIGQIACATFLAFFVAGGNFVTALVAVEILAIVVAILALGRTEGDAEAARRILPAFVVMCIGLAISIVAPGNAARQETQFPDASPGVWGTIWKSSAACFQYLASWSGGLVLIAAIAVAPLIIRAARGPVPSWARSERPWLFTFASIAIFATSFTPTFWSMGNVGPGRVQNARFEFFVVALIVNIAVWALWAGGGKALGSSGAKDGSDAEGAERELPAMAVAGSILAMVVLVCTIGAMATDEKQRESLSSVSAARSLLIGQAQAYDAQVDERLAYIENTVDRDIEVYYYTDVPKVLYMGDIRDNMDNYINYRYTQWYGKDSIIGKWRTEE